MSQLATTVHSRTAARLSDGAGASCLPGRAKDSSGFAGRAQRGGVWCPRVETLKQAHSALDALATAQLTLFRRRVSISKDGRYPPPPPSCMSRPTWLWAELTTQLR